MEFWRETTGCSTESNRLWRESTANTYVQAGFHIVNSVLALKCELLPAVILLSFTSFFRHFTEAFRLDDL